MSDGEEELVIEESSGGGAAVTQANGAAAAADAGNPIKRKRKDPPAGAPTGSGAAPPQPVRSAASSHGSSVRPGAPSAAAAAPATLDSFLVPLSAQQQSQVQNAVLGVIFSGRSNHPQHLYRNLPGPLPISITRSHLQVLQQHDYWACEKSDGERAMLYVSHEPRGAYLLDRKFLVRQIRHPVYAELWGAQGDTLLDGELVMSAQPVAAGQPLANFMAFDALMVNGTRTLDKKLSQRLEQIGRHIVLPYRAKFPPQPVANAAPAQPTTFAEMMAAEAAAGGAAAASPAAAAAVSLPPVSVGAKAFVRKHHLKDGIFDKIRHLGGDEYEYRDKSRCNKNDGVIFTPEDDDYFCKRVPLLKWKWHALNTIDFLTRAPWFDGEGKLMLYATASVLSEGGRGGGGGPTATVHMRSTQLTPEKRDFFLRSVAGKDLAIAEMQYDPSSSSWQPKNFRWDKSSPNFMTTVVATMETIIDNVQPEDLIKACARAGQGHQQPQQPRQQQQHHHRPPAAAAPPPPPAAAAPETRTVASMSPFDAVAYAPAASSNGEYVSPFG